MGTKKTLPVTIRDVAQLAGVAPGTVSKVLNNAPHISEETKARVEEAVRKLNFRRNTIARSLKMSHTATLGLITDDLEGVFTMSMMRGVEAVASAQGFSVFLCNSYGDMAREKDHLQVLLDKQVDGIILLSGYKVHERGAPALDLGQVPTVYLYQYTRAVAASCIIPDDMSGGASATRHLLELGRRRIGFLNGPPHYEATHRRLDGYRQELTNLGVAFDPALVRVGKWNEASGYQMAHELLALPDLPDALFCASDSLAVGALEALRERAVRVPEDIAVVGFDNRNFAKYQRPPLTTVALPLVEMGTRAGQLLIDAIHTGSPQQTELIEVECQLVVRQSCGAAG